MKYSILSLLFLINITTSQAQTKILFDASKAQMAGNADWIIDTDVYNIKFTGGPAALGGSESNPQQVPTPPQSGITATTTESYWTGGISAWAVDCAKLGYIVETLPYNKLVTYGDSSNPQDLTNYKVFVTVEPNIAYTPAQRDAIINFVQNGGGFFMISGHDGADRNNDGVDAIDVLNDVMTYNTIASNPFGITFDINNTGNITSSNIINAPSDESLNGSFGAVTQIKYSQGATMTINTAANSSAKGLIFTTGSSTTGNTNVLFATSTFGTGKVVALGDSSPADDGTGDTNDFLYLGYSDIGGNHRRLIMNATKWLATSNLATNEFELNQNNFNINTNPINNNELVLNYIAQESTNFSVNIYDLLGKKIHTQEINNETIGFNSNTMSLINIQSGMYLCKIENENGSKTLKFIVN